MGKYFPPVLYSTLKCGRVRSAVAIDTGAHHRHCPGPSLTADGSEVKQMGGKRLRKMCFACWMVLLQGAHRAHSAPCIFRQCKVHFQCTDHPWHIQVAENTNSSIAVCNPSHVYFVCDVFGHRNSRTDRICYHFFLTSVFKTYA